MSEFTLPYGKSQLEFTIPNTIPIDVFTPQDVPPAPDPTGEVWKALNSPLGKFSFETFRSARSAAIAINDKTRPVPHEYLLFPLLNKLAEIGIPPNATRIIVATGTHTPMATDEFHAILPPEIIQNYSIETHDCDRSDLLVDLGYTKLGTPVSINRHFFDADFKIVVGDIEPHHFMGFSGGVKSAAIGLAGRQTINSNHSMLGHPNASTARFIDNPMRQDVEEIGATIEVHLALNAILNTHKEIVCVIAGDPYEVMQTGIPLCTEICQVHVPGHYDVVIASPGGHPKDINFYQSQKALTHAALLSRDGATVVLVAACPDGVGSQSYVDWMDGMTSHHEVFQRFLGEGFRIGPHKAFQVAKIASRVNVILVSTMPPDQVEHLLITPAPDMQNAVDRALHELPDGGKVAILPNAVATIPLLPKFHC